jgi:hypothetical protein
MKVKIEVVNAICLILIFSEGVSVGKIEIIKLPIIGINNNNFIFLFTIVLKVLDMPDNPWHLYLLLTIYFGTLQA